MLHHSAWLAQRWNDPAFPAAFPWFASASYWSQEIEHLQMQVEAMEDDAAGLSNLAPPAQGFDRLSPNGPDLPD